MTAKDGHATRHRAYPPLLSHILEGKHYLPLLESPDLQHHRLDWTVLCTELIACPPEDSAISAQFHTQWHVSHHFIRELVRNDELLLDMLWVWLPRYEGPGVVLFRGENIDRFERGAVGSAWTDQENVARMFAGGLNAEGKGGIVLRTSAKADAIIAGPSPHSVWLGEREFTVDTRKLQEITPQEYYRHGKAK